MHDRIIKLLADGEFHSGQVLAEALGISRMAVWKQLQKLESEGIPVETAKGRGYRLPGGVEMLDEETIKSGLPKVVLGHIKKLMVLHSVESTNSVISKLAEGAHGVVCLAEQQTSGRGRRGRTWISPYGRNIYLSLGWRFQGGAASLEGLSLVVGLAIRRALDESGQLSLKWPNDILFCGRKLAGILVEMTGDPSGECQVVIGAGINVGMTHELAGDVGQPWADAREICNFGRNDIVVRILTELVPAIKEFEDGGFMPFKKEWHSVDGFLDKKVVLLTVNSSTVGIVRGVGDNGALLLEVNGEVKEISGGELTMRPHDT